MTDAVKESSSKLYKELIKDINLNILLYNFDIRVRLGGHYVILTCS